MANETETTTLTRIQAIDSAAGICSRPDHETTLGNLSTYLKGIGCKTAKRGETCDEATKVLLNAFKDELVTNLQSIDRYSSIGEVLPKLEDATIEKNVTKLFQSMFFFINEARGKSGTSKKPAMYPLQFPMGEKMVRYVSEQPKKGGLILFDENSDLIAVIPKPE